MTEEQAQQMMTETNAIFKEDAGRGWRKVVASPKPITIHDQASIRALVDNDFIVICAGGGGIPVTESGQRSRSRDRQRFCFRETGRGLGGRRVDYFDRCL